MQEKAPPKPNAQRSAETRQALMEAARRLFLDQGVAETGTPQIVKAAKVTRGALYHHFSDKTDLFRAIISSEAEDVANQIQRQTRDSTAPIDALINGAATYFDAMAIPGRARLLLIDGPAILGADEMRDVDRQTGGEELRLGLQAMVDAGLMDAPVDAVAELLSAMFDKAALAIAGGQSADAYKTATNRVLRGLFNTTGNA
ncbi:TetR/AcrR family transcriptional regulator [Actibacterium sp. 188UL27-1]|uniref:TetR/AcrR family transcriptional regulator n=1 Tax=Actibacterium sp. 188UL27-1 TaxID=2786961 RepID=UPI00195A4A6C|nr:TetR family transcriptional regulator [Actibacterium sp. 188UL27-1]MBM7067910.1 TetR family transcriptional regulator [Actibacterium sp. 188UL27-1]